MWRTSIVVPQALVSTYLAAFDETAETVSAFALTAPSSNDASARWQVEWLSSVAPNDTEIRSRIGVIAAGLSIEPPQAITAELLERDWVAESESRLGPVSVGRFFVRGSHVPPSHGPAVFDIVVEAGRAFGSGHHETTSACLRAIEHVARRRRIIRALDLGTGSGVLAIALAKRNHLPVVAVDIDPLAIGVATENVRLNGCAKWIRTVVSNGHRNMAELGRFDLIIANILAGPLIGLTSAIDRLARPSATIILSGIVTRQETAILAAYRRAGFALVSRIVAGDWPTLILARGDLARH
jgi:ribosomal protein L11 methyltransferase